MASGEERAEGGRWMVEMDDERWTTDDGRRPMDEG